MEHMPHEGRVLVRTVLLYFLIWILLMLGLSPVAGAICGPVDPMGAQPEMEPNDTWFMAQPLPPGLPVYGEQGPEGDSDWYTLLMPPDQGFVAGIQVDFFDARLRIWGLQAGSPLLLLEANEAGWCQGENAAFSWDPCQQLVPVDGLLVEVGSVSPAGMAHYRLTVFPGGSTVPLGDCCHYPLPTVSAFPWVDTLDTRGFRDQGLNAAKDIWIPIHLDQRALFTAGTCLAPTDFDTYLWLLDPDCETVITSDDNSCPATTRAFVSQTLDAGDYVLVLEGAGSAEGTARLALTATGVNCPPPLIPPGALEEWEPNNTAFEATPWPLDLPLTGAVDPVGDMEWLHLQDLASGYVELRLEPGDWDPALALWAGTPEGPLFMLSQTDVPGNCNAEPLQFTWDPCAVVVPGTTTACTDAWLEVHSVSPGGSGPWVATGSQVYTSVPPGDCASYPIPVGSNPYTDSQDTSAGFRDMGFGASPDVWYRLVLEHAALLEADTCPAGTAFDTVVRIVGSDGTSVIASNDDSPGCALGGGRSRTSACVGSGTYFVVVEGSGSASGVYSLRIATTPQGGNARLVVGDHGSNTEAWNNWFSAENARLWLLAGDPCNTVQEVHFRFHTEGGGWLPLGIDTDGSEGRMATLPGPPEHGDGWSLTFDPAVLGLPPEGGPVWFMADVIHPDGSLSLATCESWYQPALSHTNLETDLSHSLRVHGDTLYVQLEGSGVPALSSAVWSRTVKQDEWSRAVPAEWQRSVSDTHCSPTVAAACLEWLDATYGTDVTCGLDGEPLVIALGNACDTNVGGPGTAHSDFFNGLQEWIDGCGGGYTVHRGDGDLEEMQDQGESRNQDVIATLEWSNGGAHSVTLSSFRNLPNPDGTHTVDFMDPWTGETEEGRFDPATGTFTGYGDGGASGTLGPVYYVCPTTSGPGGGGGAGGGTIGPPLPNPLPLPLPHGRWYLELSLVTQTGHSRDLFSIVEGLPSVAPVVRLLARPAEGTLRLEWDPVPDAVGYRIHGLAEPWAAERTLLAEVQETWLVLPWPATEDRYFFQVETVYER